MAKSLKNYKRKTIGCVIVEDFETGSVFKVVGDDGVDKAINKYSENEITYIYTPTQDQRKEILGMFNVKHVEGKVSSSIKDTDVITKMIPMLTDIVVDLENEKDLEVIKENIQDPDKVFGKVLIEINNILLDVNLEYMEGLKTLGKIPMELFEAILTQQNLLGEQNATV